MSSVEQKFTPEEAEAQLQYFISLLPKDVPDEFINQLTICPPEQRSDLFQMMLVILEEHYLALENSSESVSSESSEEIEEIENEINEEDLEEFEEYLEEQKLKQELEELVFYLGKDYLHLQKDLIPMAKARELANQYNAVPYDPKGTKYDVDDIVRKSKYTLNKYIVLAISKFIDYKALTLDKLVEFLDLYHKYGSIVDTTQI